MWAFPESRGLELAGKLHDVYLSDPQYIALEESETLVRRPMHRSGGVAGRTSACCGRVLDPPRNDQCWRSDPM